MSEREDRKLRQVPVATYNYRHEAEFAAGFLNDAGIPYRLQIEDPTLGLSASSGATLWVAAFDERRARVVLDQEKAGEPPAGDDESWRMLEEAEEDEGRSRMDVEPSAPVGSPSPDSSLSGTAPHRVSSRPRTGTGVSKRKPDLTLRQRLIALGGSVATASLLGIEAVREAPSLLPIAVALVAAGLVIVGVYGRAPDVLVRILAGLSGDAP